MDPSEARLNQLGYRQDLRRALSQYGNLALAVSVGSILSAMTASFSIGYTHGGPALMVWAWLFHGFFGLCVTLSLAELCSSQPVAGSLFTWSYFLGGRHGRFWCWMTGWLITLAWITGTASAAFACAYTISTMTILGEGGIGGGGTAFTPAQLLGIAAGVLAAQGLLNLLPLRLLSLANKAGIALNVVGAVALAIALPCVAPRHQSAGFVFTYFDRRSYGYVVSDGYTAMLGFLFAVFAVSGYDSASHMAEETSRADMRAARSMYLSFVINFVLGYGLLLAILFSMQETSLTALVGGRAGGFLVAQIFDDVFFARYGSSTGAIVVLGFVTAAIFLGGVGSTTVSSRVLWAFARDGALPFSPVWQKVNRSTGTPMNAVATSTLLSIVVTLPLLRSEVAFAACISIAILGGATAYGIPIALKVFVARRNFQPGPLHLGRLSLPINLIAIAYIVLVCAAAILPTSYPITEDTLNYSPITWGGVVLLALACWWLPGRRGARRWFGVAMGNLDMLCAPEPLPPSPKQAEA